MSQQPDKFLCYSVRWVTALLHDIVAQQRANRVKRRKLRALRAEVRRLRAACRASDQVFNAMDEAHHFGHINSVDYDGAHAQVRDCLYVRNNKS